MKEKRRLIVRLFDILATIETEDNQSRIREIEGILYEILNTYC